MSKNARQRLAQLGYLDAPAVTESGVPDEGLATGAQFAAAVRDFQRRYRLKADGEFGPVTSRVLFAPRFCGVPERMNRTLCRRDATEWDGQMWPGERARCRLTWAITEEVSREFLPALRYAWKVWEDVAAVALTEVDDPREADFYYTHRRIDGASGTLAWAQLPCGRDQPQESRIDASEPWHLDPATRPPRGRVSLATVMAHENGHLIGLEHESSQSVTALLDPTYNPAVDKPQEWDTKQAQLRYGPPIGLNPTPQPPNPQPPAPGGGIKVRMTTPQGVYAGTLAEVS